MRFMSPLLLGAALTACTTAPPPASQSAAAEAKLQSLVAGKVAGAPKDCLAAYERRQFEPVSDKILTYRSGDTIYVNRVENSCARVTSGSYALVTKLVGNTELCEGDLARVQDLSTGMIVGSCTLGPFIPYSDPR